MLFHISSRGLNTRPLPYINAYAPFIECPTSILARANLRRFHQHQEGSEVDLLILCKSPLLHSAVSGSSWSSVSQLAIYHLQL